MGSERDPTWRFPVWPVHVACWGKAVFPVCRHLLLALLFRPYHIQTLQVASSVSERKSHVLTLVGEGKAREPVGTLCELAPVPSTPPLSSLFFWVFIPACILDQTLQELCPVVTGQIEPSQQAEFRRTLVPRRPARRVGGLPRRSPAKRLISGKQSAGSYCDPTGKDGEAGLGKRRSG